MEQASVFFNFTLKKFTEKSRELHGTPCDVRFGPRQLFIKIRLKMILDLCCVGDARIVDIQNEKILIDVTNRKTLFNLHAHISTHPEIDL
jgi:hypothetical protein